MEEKKYNDKKHLMQMLTLIVGLVLLAAGTSYAAYTWTYTSPNPNTISTQPIEIKFLESNTEIINITNALPMSDNEGKLEPSFDFSVTSTTQRNVNINYTLSITKLSLDSGYSALADNQMKVYLEDYEGNQLVAPTLISNLTNYQLYSGTHAHASTVTVQSMFRLRVWIDESLSSAAQNWTTSTKLQYKFKISVMSNEEEPTYAYSKSLTGNISIGDLASSIPGKTSTAPTTNKDAYLKFLITNNVVSAHYICYILNNNEYCLYSDYNMNNLNKEILNSSFGAADCEDGETFAEEPMYLCSISPLSVYINTDYGVAVNSGAADHYCETVYNGTTVHCRAGRIAW